MSLLEHVADSWRALSWTPPDRVLFLGNSITLHPPKPAVGWWGNWGMGASSRENDFVHQLLDLMSDGSHEPEYMVRNIADFERDSWPVAYNLEAELAFKPDVVVLAIGENVPAERDPVYYSTALHELFTAIRASDPTIFARSSFWPDTSKIADSAMRRACHFYGANFVDVSKAVRGSRFRASQFADLGVAAHPNDEGMRAMAYAVWRAMLLAK